ncbi:PQQ-binding-like beta-propeller repeat protein [Amycolatopsis sp.]|uniref:outer membrane protein assembly factor BamB family protein n=1 Tax=Amycolatopsis sp. TaxID=37632 RepID=UPI002C7494E2|nr:PQQ-binding-like beta-propeller repeat protein [Amycolatopsis sp.]HVV11284.1 PQQ-binding-like beta-propeller repeat protein [Amycolatopsis sp.]
MRRVLTTLTCLVAAMTIGGCSGGPAPTSQSGVDTGSGAPASTATTPAAKTADPPTAFDAAAGVPLPANAFSTNVGGGITTKFLTLRDRTAYIVAPTGMTAVDVLTGKQQWAAPVEGTPGDPDNQSGPFVNTTGPRPPAVTDSLAAAAVPVRMPEQGTTPAYITLTVLAADTATGKKAWQTGTKVSEDEYTDAGNAVTKVVAITDKAVIATYDQDGGYAGASGVHLTVALDPATGKTLWTRKEYSAGSVHGDILVGIDYTMIGSYRVQAVALDVATGQQKWAAESSRSLGFVPSDPALVVLEQNDNNHADAFLLFLDPATGAEKTRLVGPESVFGSAPAYGDCFYDEQSVLVCGSDGVLTAYDATTARKLWSLPDKTANRVAPGVSAAWHGAVYGTTQGGQPIALDAKTGKDLSTEVGIEPDWVSKYAGIGVSDDGTPMAYPVEK